MYYVFFFERILYYVLKECLMILIFDLNHCASASIISSLLIKILISLYWWIRLDQLCICGAQPVIEIARAGSVKFTVGRKGGWGQQTRTRSLIFGLFGIITVAISSHLNSHVLINITQSWFFSPFPLFCLNFFFITLLQLFLKLSLLQKTILFFILGFKLIWRV